MDVTRCGLIGLEVESTQIDALPLLARLVINQPTVRGQYRLTKMCVFRSTRVVGLEFSFFV